MFKCLNTLKGEFIMSDYRKGLLKKMGIDLHEKEISRSLWSHISLAISDEDFISEFSDKLDWKMISKVHNLSNEFILKYNHLIEWDHYFKSNEVEFSIIKKFILKTSFRYFYDFKTFHLSKHQQAEIQKMLDFKFLFRT
jgi:hypothetical protein